MNSVFGLPYHAGLAIGLVVILCYTITGGYTAVCTTDFVQGTLIFVAFVISGTIIVFAVGGPAEAIHTVKAFDAQALSGDFGEAMKNAFGANSSFSAMNVISALSWGLGYFGMPHIIVRFMGIDSASSIKTARRIGISWMLISYIGTFIIGTVGTAYLLNHGILLNGGEQILTYITGDAETVFSATMQKMYPAFIAGLFLCAILAASMSTADSQLLAASSAVSRDIYKGLIKKDAAEKDVLNIGRFVVFLIALIALLLSLNPNSSIFGLVSYAWAGFGATFGPLILLALYWKNMTAKGAIAGMIAGGIVVVAWHQIPASVAPIFGLYEILPGFIVCLAVSVIVSLLDKNKDKEMLDEFKAYKEMKD